jgi:hypothetical protein
MIDIQRTLRLLDVEAESHFVQAEAIDAINYLLRENARLRKALKLFSTKEPVQLTCEGGGFIQAIIVAESEVVAARVAIQGGMEE